MATQGPLSVATGANDTAVGTLAWTSTGSIFTSNNVRATILTFSGTFLTTNYLKGTNCGFSIPTGATINGITVEFELGVVLSFSISNFSRVSIVKADGTVGTTNRSTGAAISTTESYISFGGASDLWGETWTAENINDADFGAVLSVELRTTDPKNGGQINVDHVRITVDYTVGGSFNPAIAHRRCMLY